MKTNKAVPGGGDNQLVIPPTCKHTKPNGLFCKSPALNGDDYCYFHRSARERAKRQARQARLYLPLQIPLLEDRETIQMTLSEVMNALVQDRISSKVAGLLLYGMQAALCNANKIQFEISQAENRAHEFTGDEQTSLDAEIGAEAQVLKSREEAETEAFTQAFDGALAQGMSMADARARAMRAKLRAREAAEARAADTKDFELLPQKKAASSVKPSDTEAKVFGNPPPNEVPSLKSMRRNR
jgi:hypothetical protein